MGRRVHGNRLRVGVTGHRLNLLPEAARPAVRAAIATALAQIEAAAAQARPGAPRPELLTALAEGADRYAATAALAARWPVAAASPFGLSRYAQDFPAPEAQAEFRHLWSAARSGVILRDAEAPYAAVGRWVANRADVLLAVWNGAPPNGPGGTAEVCALAADDGAPIVWLAPDGAAAPRLILPATLAHPRTARRRLQDALAARFQSVARPAEMRRAG